MVTLASRPTPALDVRPVPRPASGPRRRCALESVSEVVADLAESSWTDMPGAACRALAGLLELDGVRYVTPAGERGRWDRDPRAHPGISGRGVQTAVSDAVRRPSQWYEEGCSILAFPVRRGGRRTAVLVGAVHGARTFDRSELQAGQLVAGAAGAAEPARETTAPALDQWEVEHADSEADVARIIFDSLTQLLDVDACCIYGLVRETNRVAPLHCSGAGAVAPGSGRTYAPGVGSAGRAMLDGRARIIRDARADPHASRLLGDADEESSLIVPVLVDATPVAALVLSRRGLDRFSPADLRTVERLAARAAAGFRMALAQVAAAREATISRALLELGDALGAQTTADSALRMLAASMRQMVPAAGLSVWRRRGSAFELGAVAGHPAAAAERMAAGRLSIDDPLFAGALDHRDVHVRLTDGSAEYDGLLGGSSRGTAVAVVPVGERAANRAVILVERPRGRAQITQTERRMLQGIADQALIALTNRELYDELEQSFLATVKALATALATKDEYTAEHACELERLCTRVGERLGLRGAELRDVGLAAALHDIGKIGIPSPILRKPAPLTPDERRVMRRHPELGARIIAPVAALDGARALVIACHEHWDGSGYPLGLSREQIPLGARIILVCDAYHAMTSDRVYRSALDPDEALRELERCSGSQFDPVVTEALLDLVR